GGVLIVGAAIARWRQLRSAESPTPSPSPTRTSINAVFWGYGLLLTLSCLPFYRNYLLVAFPFTFIWLAWIAVGRSRGWARGLGRVGLAALLVSQFVISAQFMSYIHGHAGAINGDYGPTYQSAENTWRQQYEQGARLPFDIDAMFRVPVTKSAQPGLDQSR